MVDWKQNQAAIADPSSNPNWMLDHHIMLQVAAEARKDWHQQWVYFKFVFRRMLPFMAPEVRAGLEKDWQRILELERDIKADGKPEQTQGKLLDTLHQSFINNHEAYISLNLPRAGIITVDENATADFSKHDFDLMARIVRDSQGGVQSAIEAAQGAEKRQPDASG